LQGWGLVFKARRLFYHSTLGLRAIKKKKVGGAQDLLVVAEVVEAVRRASFVAREDLVSGFGFRVSGFG